MLDICHADRSGCHAIPFFVNILQENTCHAGDPQGCETEVCSSTICSATCYFCELLQLLQCLQQTKQQDCVSQCWEMDPTQFTPTHKFVWLLMRLDIYTVIKDETGHRFKVSRIFTSNYAYSQMSAGSRCTLGNLLQGNIPFVLPCF